MTADEKIEESEYNLNKMRAVGGWKKEFIYEFNSFVSSTRSIFDHLLDDYANKYDLRIPLDAKVLRKEFRERSKGNPQADDFWKWFQQEYDKIMNDPIAGQLLKKRNVVLHRKTVTPKKFVIGMKFPEPLVISSPAGNATSASFPINDDLEKAKITVTQTDLKTGEKKITEIEQKPTIELYLEDDHKYPVDVICEALLDKVRQFVKDARTNSPNSYKTL